MWSHVVQITLIIFTCFEFTFAIGPGKILFSRKLEGRKIKTIVGISLDICKEDCQNRIHCISINYHRLSKICELNENSYSDSLRLQKAAGWIFSAKEAWPLKESGHCKSNRCNRNQTCVETNSSFECKVTECENVNRIENGTFLGNMNDVGSMRVFECQRGFGLVGSNNSICDKSGEWNILKSTKCEILCSLPPVDPLLEIKDSTIITPEGITNFTSIHVSLLSSMMIRQGSIVTYQCPNGTYLIGNPAVTCAAGTWSPLPSCICPLSLSYSYSLHKCVSLESCVNGYADVFQRYEGKMIWGNDYKQICNIKDNDCLENCRSDPTCNSFYYCFSNVWSCCYLQSLNTVDYSTLRNISACSYHQRNCI